MAVLVKEIYIQLLATPVPNILLSITALVTFIPIICATEATSNDSDQASTINSPRLTQIIVAATEEPTT